MKRLSFVFFIILVSGCGMLPGMGGGWTTLLDGPQGLDNWNTVGGANWRVVDGVVQADVRAEFWASDDANSGIYMRCADANKITDKSCYEANIFDQRPDPSYGTGGIVLNGNKTVEVDHSQFASGPIALQWGRGVIKFRKVQIKEL